MQIASREKEGGGQSLAAFIYDPDIVRCSAKHDKVSETKRSKK